MQSAKAEEKAKLMDDYSAPSDFAGAAELTEEEKHIIERKGTEAAKTGKYDKFYPTEGHFRCRKCGHPIYSAQAKFDSGCGWPAFDKCYAGAVVHKPEDDGTDRIEITCGNCAGHLGHVFVGDTTETGQRHCVNSRSSSLSRPRPRHLLQRSR